MKTKSLQSLNQGEDSKDNAHHAVLERDVEVWSSQETCKSKDLLAQETAVALVYNGVSHVVMMASPIELEAFALGFSLSEGIVSHAADIYETHVEELSEGIEVSLTVSSQCFARLKEKRRNLSGRTGCGVCGAESLQQVHLPLTKVVADISLPHAAINRATCSFEDYQPLQKLTGAYHGAAWCDLGGNILHLCEDVGRHNALDKLIGTLCMAGYSRQGREGFLLISSRASYEILQKSAMVGIGIVVAISAPTSLAIDIANQTNITLVGFSRQARHVCYTNSWRLAE